MGDKMNSQLCENRIDPLNLLRVTAIIVVFVTHARLESGIDFTKIGKIGDFPALFFLQTPAWAGVWILFFLSGYLAGKSFCKGRYSFNAKSIGKYYFTRIKKTWFPTICFVALTCLCLHRDFLVNNPKVILQMLTCTYNGSIGVWGIGHLWYVFVVMLLYLGVPLFAYIAQRLKSRQPSLLLSACILLVGLGFFYRYLGLQFSWNWFHHTYTAPYANLDLFLSGLLMSYYNQSVSVKPKKAQKSSAYAIMAGLILLNSLIYVYADNSALALKIYRYYLPSAYLLACMLYCYALDREERHFTAATWEQIKKNPARLIDRFSSTGIYFYFFHMAVLHLLVPLFSSLSTLTAHLLLLVCAFVVSWALGAIYSLPFKRLR